MNKTKIEWVIEEYKGWLNSEIDELEELNKLYIKARTSSEIKRISHEMELSRVKISYLKTFLHDLAKLKGE